MNPAADDPIKTWEVKASTGRHFDVLDGIRGVAILMVVVYHTFYVNPVNRAMKEVQGFIESGWIGVPVFFVLSGFLISYPFFQAREKDARAWYIKGYARRRLGKILPPFYLSILLFCVFYMLWLHDTAYLTEAWQWALGLPNFFLVGLNFNRSYWSLVVEAGFYVVLPLLFLVTRGLKTKPAAAVIFLVMAIIPPVMRALTWPPAAAAAADMNLVGFRMARFPCMLDYFAWGVLFAAIYVVTAPQRGNLRHLSRLGYAGLVLMVVTLELFGRWAREYGIHASPQPWSVEFFQIAPSVAAFLMLFFVFDPECAASRLLGSAWLRFVGLVSYEWFLFHGPVVNLFSRIFGKTHGNALDYGLKTVAPLALTFLFSVAVYRWFSLPLLNRIRESIKK